MEQHYHSAMALPCSVPEHADGRYSDGDCALDRPLALSHAHSNNLRTCGARFRGMLGCLWPPVFRLWAVTSSIPFVRV